MGRIHLLMPMGGGGTRFGNKGFNVPKPLIELQGKPFLYWATKCVTKYIDVEDITFIVLKEHIEHYNIDKVIYSYFPGSKIHVIPEVLNGAVLTCMAGLEEIEDDSPVLFNDCDHAFKSWAFSAYCEEAFFDGIDGGLLTFKSDNPAFSYAEFDSDKNVIGTIEKKVVSDEAICGAYYFKNKTVFKEATETYLKNCNYKEFFVSGVYNELIAKGGCVKTFPIDEHISFGTPEEYDLAIADKRLGELL